MGDGCYGFSTPVPEDIIGVCMVDMYTSREYNYMDVTDGHCVREQTPMPNIAAYCYNYWQQ